jgi:internalin A
MKTTYDNFRDWCKHKENISDEAKHTVEILLQISDTSECDLANELLSNTTELNLKLTQITDISPLSSFTQLTNLILGSNQISDIAQSPSSSN